MIDMHLNISIIYHTIMNMILKEQREKPEGILSDCGHLQPADEKDETKKKLKKKLNQIWGLIHILPNLRIQLIQQVNEQHIKTVIEGLILQEREVVAIT